MRKVKHNKIRNTGLLYEFLLRQITLDVLKNTNTSKAVDMIKKRFSANPVPIVLPIGTGEMFNGVIDLISIELPLE